MLLEKHRYNEPRSRKESKTLKGKNVRTKCSHWIFKWRLSLSFSPPLSLSPHSLFPLLSSSYPFSRSFSIFGRVRDIFESLTAIKTLIKWDGASQCSGGTYPTEREKGSVRSRRVSEAGRRGERTSCGESILLRRRLRGSISSFFGLLFLALISLFFFFLSHLLSTSLYGCPLVAVSLNMSLSCSVYITNGTFPRG